MDTIVSADQTVGRRRARGRAGLAGAIAICVGLACGVAGASTSTSEGIVSIAPHALTSGMTIGAGRSVAYVVSGGTTTVPSDATRALLQVTAKNETAAGTLTGQPYLDAADASTDSLSWPAAKTTVSGTFLEPVGVSNKVAFTNVSSGTVTVAVTIIGYSTSARLANRLDAVEGNQRADEATISELQAAVASLTDQVNADQQTIARDDSVLQSLPRLTIVPTFSLFVGQFRYQLTGANLAPGSVLTTHYIANGTPMTTTLEHVGADGSISVLNGQYCVATNVYVTGVDMGGNPLASNQIAKGQNCP